MRVVHSLIALISSVLIALPALATEHIRVLVVQGIPEVEVYADRGLSLALSTGRVRELNSRVRVSRGATGVRVDGENMGTGRITLSTGSAELVIAGAATALPVGGVVQILDDGIGLLVINEVDLEEYVKGVVPSEMNAGWHPEALKVQAVATRTYALHQRMMNGSREYDVVATIQDQVYRGRERRDRRVEQAVDATHGLVLTFQNLPIFAAFSSTAAGPTEDAANVWAKDLPYLKGVDCPFDANSPYYQWRIPIQLKELEQTLRRQGIAVGEITGAVVFSRSRAGRVTRLRILHSQGELIVRAEELRRVVGYSVIPSTQFDLRFEGHALILLGRGAGHGVGLCQWGAKELAERGYSYQSILRYYFPGTELKDLRFLDLSAVSTP